MGIFRRAALALILASALPVAAWAQAAPAATAASAAKTEAEAAMERAQRLAANPMRVILEASKFRRKAPVEAAEAAPEAADAANLRRTAARTAAAEAALTATTSATTAASPRDEAVITPRSVPAPRAAPVPAEPVNVLLTTSNALAVPAAAAQLVPAMEASRRAEPIAALPKAAALPLATLSVAREQPRLAQSVPPQFPTRLQPEAMRLTEVAADLTIRADGSVAGVVLASSVPRPLQQYIVAALLQWRFEPLSGTQAHRVQMVFSDQ